MISQDDINIALAACNGDRNPYRLASWLCSMRFHYWEASMMDELRAYLGLAKGQVDDSVAAGIGSVLAADGRILRRGPRLMKQDRQHKQIKAELHEEG